MEVRRGKTPGNNQAQNAQYKGAVKEIGKIIGRKLDNDELKELHENITGEGLGFWEIVRTGVQDFGEPDDYILTMKDSGNWTYRPSSES
jgi:hypothetical protein